MKRSCIYVCYVHRYLCDAVLVYEPADCLAALQRARNHHGVAVLVLDDLACDRIAFSLRASLLAYVERYCIGAAGRCRVEVVVHGNEEVAGSDVSGSCLRSTFGVMSRAEVWLTLRVAHLLRKSFVFTCAAYGKILSLRLLRSRFIAVAWHLKFAENALSQLSCQFSAFFECDS